MEPQILTLAADVIARSDREHPADQILRATLKQSRLDTEWDAALVARAVFQFYRWFGWVDQSRPLAEQIEMTARLAESFAVHPGRFTAQDLAARAVPDWTQREVDFDAAWFKTLQSEPKLFLRARRGHGPELSQKLGDCRVLGPSPLDDTLEYLGTTDLFRTREFHSGEFEVQDLNSQVVGFICAPQPGATWWDACAGEGGKTLHLAELMQNKGLIWATDRQAWRLQSLKRRAARAKVFNYRAALWHRAQDLPTKTKFDGVLVDAPCSGVGTWQRNPHARWTTQPVDVAELAALQLDLLTRAARAVKPGGTLVYSVCTLTRSETTQVAQRFAQDFAEFEPVPVRNPLDPQSSPTPEAFFWPQAFGGNGMFVAVWTRRKSP